jgi:uncharacterized SAM-binding protein YcdF (DUF218 family)
MMPINRRLFYYLSAGAALSAAAALFCCLTIGRWLAVRDPLPERVDVVYMFFGENARFSYARGLMERFPGAHLVMSDNFRQYSRVLSREGFDMTRVTALDTCRSTLSEITALDGWLQDNREKLVRAAPQVRIGLVSSPCHMRRIRFMARDVIRDTAFACFCLPVPLERYGWTDNDLRRWWRTGALRNWVASETAKLLWYWLFF